MDNGQDVTAPKICSLIVGPTCHDQFEFFNWTIDVPPKPTKIAEKVSQSNRKSKKTNLPNSQ